MSVMNLVNKLKPFVPGLAGYGQSAHLPLFVLPIHSKDLIKQFPGVAAGSVAIFFTSEWIGKNLLQFVPIYNRLEHCWKQPLVLTLLLLLRKYTNYKERDM